MQITKLTPNFEVKDVIETVAYYESLLGFKLVMCVPESQDGIEQSFAEDKSYVYAMMQKDNVEIFFQRSDSFREDVVFAQGLPIGASVSFYMDVKGIKEFHQKMKEKSLQITDLKTAWYGMHEFYLKDLNGYILGFAEKAG
ncbi:hypothetical protein [Longitalea arenae]|uniref:hypothetical protein n=1 Tax=Longitalea arenae TaxID=2812558 RepID=UPI0019678A75|nr:hypothetical protein [Longitalea arenae]